MSFQQLGSWTYQSTDVDSDGDVDYDVFGLYSYQTGMLVPVFDMAAATGAANPSATVNFGDYDRDGFTDDVGVTSLDSSAILGTYMDFGSDVFGYYTSVGYNNPGAGDYRPGSTAVIHYTEDDKNGDSAWALTFQGHGGTLDMPGGLPYVDFDNNHWLVAFETFNNPGTYKDFDDFIVVVESVQPVPEPATMLLLGAGLIGLAGMGRKKFFKKS